MPAYSEYTISLPGEVTIGLSSTGELAIAEHEQLLLGAYLPEVEIVSGISSEVEQVVQHLESDDKSLRQGKHEIEIKDTWNGQFPMDLPHLLYGIARASWIRRNLFPVHAACTEGAVTTLLPGNSGVGKSTVVMELALHRGQKIVSGNTTLVAFEDGAINTVAGTQIMTLKTQDFAESNIEPTSSVTYGDRTAFKLESAHYAPGTHHIGRIALIQLSSYAQQWNRVEQGSALHRLYAHFLDTAYQDVVTCEGNGLYVGQDAPENRRYLVGALRNALQGTPVIQGLGHSHYLAEKISA